MDRISYTWYPNDWKQSDTFLDVDDVEIRYYYREIIDILYLCGNAWPESRQRFEKSQRVKISDQKWEALKGLFTVVEKSHGQFLWSHESVEKRIDKRSVTSAENGRKGGRPEGSEKPKNNLKNNLPENLIKPNKALEGNRTELNLNTKPSVGKGVGIYEGVQLSRPPRPFWEASVRDKPADAFGWWMTYADMLADKLSRKDMNRESMEKAFWFFWPNQATVEGYKAGKLTLSLIGDRKLQSALEDLVVMLRDGAKYPAIREQKLKPREYLERYTPKS